MQDACTNQERDDPAPTMRADCGFQVTKRPGEPYEVEGTCGDAGTACAVCSSSSGGQPTGRSTNKLCPEEIPLTKGDEKLADPEAGAVLPLRSSPVEVEGPNLELLLMGETPPGIEECGIGMLTADDDVATGTSQPRGWTDAEVVKSDLAEDPWVATATIGGCKVFCRPRARLAAWSVSMGEEPTRIADLGAALEDARVDVPPVPHGVVFIEVTWVTAWDEVIKYTSGYYHRGLWLLRLLVMQEPHDGFAYRLQYVTLLPAGNGGVRDEDQLVMQECLYTWSGSGGSPMRRRFGTTGLMLMRVYLREVTALPTLRTPTRMMTALLPKGRPRGLEGSPSTEGGITCPR